MKTKSKNVSVEKVVVATDEPVTKVAETVTPADEEKGGEYDGKYQEKDSGYDAPYTPGPDEEKCSHCEGKGWVKKAAEEKKADVMPPKKSEEDDEDKEDKEKKEDEVEEDKE
jgi:hypothetical protein